jgi:hypothetical protein
MRNRVALAMIAGLTLLTGCSNGSSTPAAAPSGKPAAPARLPDSAAPPAAGPPEQHAASPGARLTVTDIAIAGRPGFAEVVYHLGGSGHPGWQVRYTDRAVRDGSGTALDVAGSSVLEVRILGSAYPWDSGVAGYEGPDPLCDPAVPGITGVYGASVYEGTTQSFIGVNSDHPAFSVTAADNPARLIVDIATP